MRTIAAALIAAALLTGCTDTVSQLPAPEPQPAPVAPAEGS